jgi:hypothetical protein
LVGSLLHRTYNECARVLRRARTDPRKCASLFLLISGSATRGDEMSRDLPFVEQNARELERISRPNWTLAFGR